MCRAVPHRCIFIIVFNLNPFDTSQVISAQPVGNLVGSTSERFSYKKKCMKNNSKVSRLQVCVSIKKIGDYVDK